MASIPPTTPSGDNVPVQYPEPVRAKDHHAADGHAVVYTREQKGHSIILHWFVLGIFSMFIVPVFYTVSPRHYWHI